MERVYTEEGIRFLEQGEEKAAILEKMEENAVTVSLSGTFSGGMANMLEDELTALIVCGQGVTLDLDQVAYLSPSTMEVFLRMETKLEEKGKYLRIIQMPQPVYDEFKARGMHELLEIEVKKA